MSTNEKPEMKKTSTINALEETDSCDTFMEYFYIFGANETTIKREEFYTNSLFTKPGMLKMQLISKFPPFEKPNSNMDENVIMNHCFPKGFHLLNISNNGEEPKNECFHFSLDNLHSLSDNDKKLYFTCLTFYEPLQTYYEILIRIKKHIKKSSLKTITSAQKQLIQSYYVPKAICLSSFVPFPNEEKYLLTKMLAYVKGMTKGVGTNIIVPIEKVIEKLILGIPRPPKGKFFITYKNSNCIIPNTEPDYNIMQRELNQYNFYSYKMHLIFMFKFEEIMEIIKCLLLEIPILFFSESKEKLTNIFETFLFLLAPFEYQYPHISILPDINSGILEQAPTFAFGINHKWITMKNNERKNYFEMFNINIFNKFIKIVDIDKHSLTSYFNKNDTQHIVLFTDLGEKTKDLGDDVDLSIYQSKEINSDSCNEAVTYALPDHYVSKFKKRILEFLEGNKMKTSDCNLELNRKIGDENFYYFLVCVFQNYNKYLNNTKEEVIKTCKKINETPLDKIPVQVLFNTTQFMKDFKGGGEMFMTKFFETRIFKDFLVRKYLNRDSDKFKFLLFDETILSKRNRSFFSRKIKTEFLESKILQATHCYGVDSTKNFSQEEYTFLSSHQDNLIYYYQRFNGVLFNYYLFPKLIYDNKYFEKLYIPPKFFDKFLYQQMQEYHKSIEALEQPKYFKIYEGDLVVRYLYNAKEDEKINREIENDIILLWLRMFCMTFYYCESKEKIIRFVEMLSNLKKAIYLKDKILFFLLATLKKYGEDYMIIKLFEFSKNFSYTQYSYLANSIFSQNIREQQLKQLAVANGKLMINYFKNAKEDDIKIFDLNNINLSQLRHRTFFYDGIDNSVERLKFEDPQCPKCKTVINLKNFVTSYDKFSKNNEIKCINCKEIIKLECNVKIGIKDITDKAKFNIINPYYLYNNMSSQLIKIYGNKIDLSDLRNMYNDFFWNCVLYFKAKGLSCDMLFLYNQKYKVKVEEKKPVVVNKEASSKKNKKKEKIVKEEDTKNVVKRVFMGLEIVNKVIDVCLK